VAQAGATAVEPQKMTRADVQAWLGVKAARRNRRRKCPTGMSRKLMFLDEPGWNATVTRHNTLSMRRG